MTDDVRLCKDCRYFKPNTTLPSLSKCSHVKSIYSSKKINIVTGYIHPPEQNFCEIFRGDYKYRLDISCGLEARYFEPKEKQEEVSFILKTYNSAWLCFGIFVAIVFALKMFL